MDYVKQRLAALLTALVFAVLCLPDPACRTVLQAQALTEIDGIDISKYQEEINWKEVAAGDIKFAILRCCKVIRSYEDWEVDSTFDQNYEEAKAAGLAVGCYMFTDAATEEEFEEDVDYMLGFLKDKSFEFPVFLDLESPTRQEHLPSEVFMPALLAGLERIEDAGYTAGVYSSTAFFSECINRRELQEAGYAIWEANYFNTVNGLASPEGYDLSAEADIWQYSGNGRAPGIKTTVDCNICYTTSYFTHAASMANSLLPSGTMPAGSNFTIAGTISSESVLRTITGAIYNLANPAEPVQTVTVYPHAREYKLTGFFTKKLIFSSLPEGEYELRITAVDSSDTQVNVAQSQFIIGEGGTPLNPADPSETGIAPDGASAWQPPAPAKKNSRHTGLRFAIWFYDHWSVRSMARRGTIIGYKLKLQRTPLYRMVSSTCYSIEACYLAATLRLKMLTKDT